jgi:hypothetical protein
MESKLSTKPPKKKKKKTDYLSFSTTLFIIFCYHLNHNIQLVDLCEKTLRF